MSRGGSGFEKDKAVIYALVCPRCGKTVHIRRKYCVCHAPLNWAAAVPVTEGGPAIGRCNFETDGLVCGDCPEGCGWCASYGLPGKNRQGYGGLDCEHYRNDARCGCCRAQVKIALGLAKENIAGIIGTVNGGRLMELADFIKVKIQEPVLARIQARRGR